MLPCCTRWNSVKAGKMQSKSKAVFTTAVRDCTTCGWGVAWTVNVLDPERIHGKCLWECPVPHPKQFGIRFYYSANSKPETDCPVWKPAENLENMQQWAEHPRDYSERRWALADALMAEMKLQEFIASQCLRCRHEPEWQPKNACFPDMKKGICAVGMSLHRWRSNVLIDGESEPYIFTTDCPSFKDKE